MLGIPRGGQDVDWAAVTRTRVASVTTLPPPVAIDPMIIIKEFKERQQQQIASATERIDIIPEVPRECLRILVSARLVNMNKEKFFISRLSP